LINLSIDLIFDNSYKSLLPSNLSAVTFFINQLKFDEFLASKKTFFELMLSIENFLCAYKETKLDFLEILHFLLYFFFFAEFF